MTKSDFLTELDRILERRSDGLLGPEQLRDLEEWDSLAVVSLIALVDRQCGVQLQPRAIAGCNSAEDLWALVNPRP